MSDTIVKTTIRVPSKLWDRTKIRAIQEHIPLEKLIVNALVAYLSKGGAQ